MTVTKRKPKPITAHPMFPVVTALWFAAFLSLGSFAVAPALLEGPVVALGIPEILPAAQPPLGFTVRALVAIVMMGVGGLVGYLIGRRLAQGKVEAPVRARSFGSSAFGGSAEKATSPARQPLHRRPLNPSEDLGDPMADAAFAPPSVFAADSFAEEQPYVTAEQATVKADSSELVRLPWEEDFSAPTARGSVVDDILAEDPLALDLLFEDAEIVAEEAAAGESPAFVASTDETVEHEFDAVEPSVNAEAPAQLEPSQVEPSQLEAVDAAIADPAPAQKAMPLIKTPLLQAPAAAHVPLARTALEELGLVQLTERLALAIGRRNARAQIAPQSSVAVAPYAVPTVEAIDHSPAPQDLPESAGQNTDGFSVVAPQQAPALARFPSSHLAVETEIQEPSLEPERVVQLRPAAMQPFVAEFDAEEDDDDIPGLARFLRAPERQPLVEPADEPVDAFADEDEFDDADEDEDSASDLVQTTEFGAEPDVAENRYPSLLDMGSRGLRHQPLLLSLEEADWDEAEAEVEIDATDAEPVDVFPGQSSPIQAAPRPFERPSAMGEASALPASIIPVAGSPLATPGRAAPSSPMDQLAEPVSSVASTIVDAEEANRALRAALATLQRMTAQG